MLRKNKFKGRGDRLTVAETNQLNSLQPGKSMAMRGMTIKCFASSPCQSGTNCRSCALHDIICSDVACMAGARYTDAEGISRIRTKDVYYSLAL